MASCALQLSRGKLIEDPLEYLPCSKTLAYKKGDVIYGPAKGSDTLYLIISGTVKVTRFARLGQAFLIDLYTTGEFLGETGILNLSNAGEASVSFQSSTLMAWATADLADIIVRRPQLGIALLQVFSQRFLRFQERAESLSFETIAARLARALIYFSKRLGAEGPDGSIIMAALTHELLAQYVSTSREQVSVQMAAFRRQGYIQYSRRAITLHRDALEAWLKTASTIAE
ncbi:MAG: transcriptional regulator, Crp/Fnr family [Candidatus Solibacter sp.]|nr:transcriptional regulator, Crp/Fnr family [Candidatus Solibacter sp.]